MGLLHETLQEVGDLRARIESVLPVVDRMRFDRVMSGLTLPSDRSTNVGESPSVSLTASQTLWQSPLAKTLDANAATETLTEPQADYLKIPSSRAAPESLLQWPVFEGKYPVGSLAFPLDGTGEGELDVHSGVDDLGEVAPIQLVENFLAYVHIKNPLLDAQSLRVYARRVSEVGFLWDGPSCLVVSIPTPLLRNAIDCCRPSLVL